MSQSEVEDFLEHHGIKGMKWGVRRDNPSGRSKTASTNQKPSSESKVPVGSVVVTPNGGVLRKATSAEQARKAPLSQKQLDTLRRLGEDTAKEKGSSTSKISSMSDAEIKERINRMQMEKQYKQLMAEKNPKKTAAKDFILGVLKDAGKQAATDVLKSAASAYGKQAIGIAMTKSKNPAVSAAGAILKSPPKKK